MEHHIHTRELFEILSGLYFGKQCKRRGRAGACQKVGVLVFEVQEEVQIRDVLILLRTLHVLLQKRFATVELMGDVVVRESIRLSGTGWTRVRGAWAVRCVLFHFFCDTATR